MPHIIRILATLLVTLAFVLTGNAYALKFSGDAWVAQHIENNQATDEYFLVVKEADLKRIKLKGIKFKKQSVERDFFQLTNQMGNEGITFRQIDTDKSRKFKKLDRKAKKRSRKLIQKGLLAEEDRQEWMDDWVAGRLEDQLFKLVFKNDRKRYVGRIGFTTFDNPFEYPENVEFPSNEGGTTPVPEPTTLLLMGTGLLGLAVFRRRNK